MILSYQNRTGLILLLFILIGMNSCTGERNVDAGSSISVSDSTIDGWKPAAIRETLKPQFAYSSKGGMEKNGSFLISMEKAGQQGYWTKTFKIKGDQFYYFSALKKTNGVQDPRREAIVTIRWKDVNGHSVNMDSALSLLAANTFDKPLSRTATRAELEFPVDQPEKIDGWTRVSGIYQAPSEAAFAEVRLYLMWAAGGSVEWSEVKLSDTSQPAERSVRIASVQYGPAKDIIAKNQVGACSVYEPMIKEASDKKADIICLPEFITARFSNLDMYEAAEPIPGPSTKYLGEIAKKYNIYIVAGLVESDSGQVYNTAVLIGDDGTLVGKYRKISVTSPEYFKYGIAPGNKYPVFDTRFGKVGMMICWDLQFPEVARKLSENGAEIILMPIAGGNPKLASARAIENQIYLVSSTYSERPNWLRSGVYDYEGNMMVTGKNRGDVVVAEVDLNKSKYWAHLGNLKEMIKRQRPELD